MLPMDLWSLVLEPTPDIVFGDVEFMQCGGLFVWKCILVLENKSEDIRDLQGRHYGPMLATQETGSKVYGVESFFVLTIMDGFNGMGGEMY